MTKKDPQRLRGEQESQGRTARDKVFRVFWAYARGWLLIVVLFLIAKAISEAYSRVSAGVEPVFRSFESAVPNVVVAIAILTLGPWALGRMMELFHAGRLFQRQRGIRAIQQMEERLTTELRIDDRRGYRVVLVNWPSEENRSLGLIMADLLEPETGRPLAAVFLPNTPDPTKGAIRVVSAQELVHTDWDFSDLGRFHATFGSAAPDLSDDDDREG